ncbi:MAG: hypothetical protein ABI539_10415 [Acidobacteriota bacterium]
MNIARIVTSNSHIDYVARVIDSLDSADAPAASDHCFGQFVRIGSDKEAVIGVIYDSKLINPEYANFGPRLSPRPALGNFSPDFINEQGILIGILLLGTLSENGVAVHGVPPRVVPPGDEVSKLDTASFRKFHVTPDGVNLHYYAQVVNHSGPFAVPLLHAIIDALSADLSEAERQRLGVLKNSLAWQAAIGSMKL